MTTVLQILKSNEKSRLRKNKPKVVAYIMKEKYPNTFKDIPLEKLAEIIKEIGTLDREWRRKLQIHPELRGPDYKGKKKVEEFVQRQLDYNI